MECIKSILDEMKDHQNEIMDIQRQTWNELKDQSRVRRKSEALKENAGRMEIPQKI